jgi:hypothetical protein
VWLRDPWTELAAARAGSPRVWVATNGDIKRGRDLNVGTVLVDGSVAGARKFMRLWFSRRGWAMQDALRRHEQDSLTILQGSGTIGDSVAAWQCAQVMTACCYRPRHGNLTAPDGPVLFHAACVDIVQLRGTRWCITPDCHPKSTSEALGMTFAHHAGIEDGPFELLYSWERVNPNTSSSSGTRTWTGRGNSSFHLRKYDRSRGPVTVAGGLDCREQGRA